MSFKILFDSFCNVEMFFVTLGTLILTAIDSFSAGSAIDAAFKYFGYLAASFTVIMAALRAYHMMKYEKVHAEIEEMKKQKLEDEDINGSGGNA